MSEDLKVFGKTYSGVTGIQAKDTNGDMVVFTSGAVDTLSQAINGTLTGDIVISTDRSFSIDDRYNRLFEGSPITSLKSTGLNPIPYGFVRNCTSLTSIEMDNYNCNQLGCCGCTSLISARFPNMVSMDWGYSKRGNSFFEGCTNLVTVFVPLIERVNASMFMNCKALDYIDLKDASYIDTNAFLGCTVLDLVILRKNSVVTLATINSIASGTPFNSSGTGGTLYVPQALISEYQSATNWSTVLGYANNSIQAIEGSQYENYYADGTPIPTA